MATELKPCPFCGGEADIADFGCFSVYCKKQCVEQPVAYPDKETAIKAWNRRAAKTPCNLCRFNPPSSMDGKPCTICVADGRAEDEV